MTETTRHAQKEMYREDKDRSRVYRAPYLFGDELLPVRALLDELAPGPNDAVVEFGSGDGRFTLPIARSLEKQGGRGLIFGCDFSSARTDELGSRAEEEGLDIRVRAIHLGELPPRVLPFHDERADAVLSVNTLQYLADPGPYLEEFARILAPCGKLLIADWRDPALKSEGQSTNSGASPEFLFAVLETGGMEVSRVNLGGFSWAIRAIKPMMFTI